VDNVRDHFSKFGKLIDCSVIKDPVTKLSRGFGFVEFEGGIPSQLLEFEHVIDKRKCGVKPYTYEAS
jgi:RNA recognition motif-containing protein